MRRTKRNDASSHNVSVMMKKAYERRDLCDEFLLLAIVLIAISIPGGVLAQPAISSEIAPLGKLRVATNGGNPRSW